MKPRARTLVPAAFLVHLVEVVVSAPPAVLGAGFLATETRALGADVMTTDAALEALVALGRGRANDALLALAAAAIAMLLLHAPVQMAFLHALSGTGRRALVDGLRHAPRAIAVSFLVGAAGFVLAAASLCLPIAAHLALPDAVNTRSHDLIVLALAAPLVLVVGVVALVHDLARASLVSARRDPLEALEAALRAVGVRSVLEYAAFSVAGAALAAAAVGLTVRGGSDAAASAAILGAHGLLFARTLVRGVWLGRCLARTEGSTESRAEETAPASVEPDEPDRASPSTS